MRQGLCCLCHCVFWDMCPSKPASRTGGVSSTPGWAPGHWGHVLACRPCLKKVWWGLPHPGRPLPLCIPGGPLVTADHCGLSSMSRTRASRREGRFCTDPLWGPCSQSVQRPPGVIQRQDCYLCRQCGSAGCRGYPPPSCTEKPGAPPWAISRHSRCPSLLSTEALPFRPGPAVGSERRICASFL